MNAPVTTPPARTTATGGTASRSSGPTRGGDASAFASMLDDALSTDRNSGRGPSDRGIDRRSTPDERASRAADRAADRADRNASAADRAADRAADHADKAADKAAGRTGHRSERAAANAARRGADRVAAAGDEIDAAKATAVDGTNASAVPPVADETAPVTTDVPATDPAGAGLPTAVWAVLMGAPAAPVNTSSGVNADVPTAVAALAAAAVGPAATAVAPGAAPSAAVAATATAAEAGQPQQAAVTTAAPAAPVVPASAPTPTAAEAALAQFTVVRADDAAPAAPAAAPVAPAPGPTARPAAAAVPTTVAAPSAESPVDVPAAPPTASAAAAALPPADTVAVPVTPTAARTPDTSAPAPASGSVPAIAVGSAGQAQSTGADTSSQQGSADHGAAPATTPVAAVGTPVAATPLLAPAPVIDSDGTTGASAAQPVGSQVARQVAVLSNGPDGAHTMTLVLTPDSVGPVEVQVTLQKGTVDLTLRGAHEHGRAALLDALPDLRRDLEAAGLTPSRLEVDRDSGGAWLDRHSAQQQAEQQAMAQHQGFGDRGGRQERAEGRSRPWGAPADTGISGPASPMNRSTSSGVDYRV